MKSSMEIFQVDFCFNDTATTEIYTLSLHDALPIYFPEIFPTRLRTTGTGLCYNVAKAGSRSEEHTSELQSQHDLVCRLLLEKKKKRKKKEKKKKKKKKKEKKGKKKKKK